MHAHVYTRSCELRWPHVNVERMCGPLEELIQVYCNSKHVTYLDVFISET